MALHVLTCRYESTHLLTVASTAGAWRYRMWYILGHQGPAPFADGSVWAFDHLRSFTCMVLPHWRVIKLILIALLHVTSQPGDFSIENSVSFEQECPDDNHFHLPQQAKFPIGSPLW